MIPARIIDEIHTFLWMKPLTNKGIIDAGWNCRDHALVLGALFAAQGRSPVIAHGRNMLVCGPSKGNPPIGIGQELGYGAGHTWLDVEGITDISIKPPNAPQTKKLMAITILAGVCRTPVGLKVINCLSEADYQNAIGVGSHEKDQLRVVYLEQKREPFTFSILQNPFPWVYSPLSERLRQEYPPGIYANLVMHLLTRLERGGRSLADRSLASAWKAVAKRGDVDTQELAERIAAVSNNSLPA